MGGRSGLDPGILPDRLQPVSTGRTSASGCSDAISASTHGGADYANRPLSSAAQLYFRITTRILGPRNTVRYLQVMVVL